MLTSTGAKQDNFALLSTITETEGLSTVFDVVLNLCALVFKLNVKGAEEFQLILDDLGLKGKNGEGAQQSFAKYLQRVENLNAVTEDEDAAMTMKVDKKFPLNMQMQDEQLCVSNPRVVDIEWKTVYALASKNLNKLMQPVFKITLTLLCQGDFQKGGVSEMAQRSSKRN